MFGLHRSMRGAIVGHFAGTEITSSPGARRIVDALVRMEAPAPCIHFYAEHVEADAVHEQVLRNDVVGNLIRQEPGIEKEVVFGLRALSYVEDRLARTLMAAWTQGQTALIDDSTLLRVGK